MKKSDELDRMGSMEENDFRAWDLHFKAERERRKETFDEWFLPILKECYQIEYQEDRECYRFRMKFHQDVLFDFYPKGDKVHYHRPVKWVKDGLNHIISRLPKHIVNALKNQ